MSFEFINLELKGLVLVKPTIFKDERGFFIETYKRGDFEKAGIKEEFVQDNHSRSSRGVLRGLHFQRAPNAQGKLVRCFRGRIFDAAADIRKDSATFGRWAGFELNEDNSWMLYIPPGFAHGFLVLSGAAEIIYKCTREYSPADDSGIRWSDPQLAVAWGIKDPVLSEKDKSLPLLKDVEL